MVRDIKNLYHLAIAVFANGMYGFPARRLRVIGVTGTDGKTTTTSLIYHILTSSGKKASMISTVYAKIGDQTFDTGLHTTTPASTFVQKMIRKSLKAQDEFLVLETTSHALDQNRVWGVPFEVGVITNITHEHLDYHKTYENYVRTKARLLLHSKHAFLNRDDISYPYLTEIFKTHNFTNYVTYGLSKEADLSLDISKVLDIEIPDFNKYNFLAAYAACRQVGVSEEDIFAAIKTFVLPKGRIEEFKVGNINAVIDFAHTPNAIEKILQYIKKKYTKGRIIHVFGSAGLRDVTKRPLMGQASGMYSDIAIITEEDYRTENIEDISSAIAEGFEREGFSYVDPTLLKEMKTKVYTKITDRGEAIKKAVEIAKDGDVIVLTGKGHETSLARGTKEVPWSDQAALTKSLSKEELL